MKLPLFSVFFALSSLTMFAGPITNISEDRLPGIQDLCVNKYRWERFVAAGSSIFFTLLTTALLAQKSFSQKQERDIDDKNTKNSDKTTSTLHILVPAGAALCGLYYLERYNKLELMFQQGLMSIALKQ